MWFRSSRLRKIRAPPACSLSRVGLVQRGRPTAVVPLQPVQLVEECLVAAGLLVGGGDLLDDGHQRLGDESSPVDTEMALGIGVVDGRFGDGRAGTRQLGAGEIGHWSA